MHCRPNSDAPNNSGNCFECAHSDCQFLEFLYLKKYKTSNSVEKTELRNFLNKNQQIKLTILGSQSMLR